MGKFARILQAKFDLHEMLVTIKNIQRPTMSAYRSNVHFIQVAHEPYRQSTRCCKDE